MRAQGKRAVTTLTYWRYQDYAGIGPGAHGRRGGFATTRHKKPENYLKAVGERGHGIAEQHSLAPRDQAAEAILMGLRLAEGLNLGALETRFDMGRGDMINESAVQTYSELGFVWQRGDRIGVEAKGLAVLNTLIAALANDALVEA